MMRLAIITGLFFLSYATKADKIEKGFEKLRVYDYFTAKEYFEKALDSDPVPAAYGLSVIYSTDNNPFYHPDSARRYILLADTSYNRLKERKKKNYAEIGVTDSVIRQLNDFICEDAFQKAKTSGTVNAYNHYIRNFSTCGRIKEAISSRNISAFDSVSNINTSNAYKSFMSSYPQSEQFRQALSKYEERIFAENTDGTIESYEYFIQNFPENPYRKQAEKNIYTLSVPGKKLEEYVLFVRRYKNSRHTEEAWREIYKLAMKDFTEKSFAEFKSTYPDYPFPEELDTDFLLQNYVFLPFTEKDLWGYINELGQEMIRPMFEEASVFSEGLAAVVEKGKYGYINKSGKKIIENRFNDAEAFHHAAAVVMEDTLYGLINKSGEYLIKPAYEELSEVSEDIYMAVHEGYSGYVSKTGDTITGFIYDVANDFRNGYAVVSKDEKYGLINSGGSYNIPLKFDELAFISNTLLKAMNEDELWGIINIQGDTILSFAYDAIGEFSENRAIVVRKDKCGYIDEQGVIVIPLTFRYMSIMLNTANFENGYALLKQKLKSVVIDSTGKIISFPGVEDYGIPSSGLIPVRKNRKWGYAQMNGKIRIPCKYEAAEPFRHGFAIVHQNKMAGLIDTTGLVLISPLYEDIVVMEKVLLVRANGKSGLLSRNGILLVPCSYDKIEFITPFIARASNQSGFKYINLETGKIIYNSEADNN